MPFMVSVTHAERNPWVAATPSGWLGQVSQDRPIYDCLDCKELAMQFHHQLGDQPDREDFFRCCACGRCWDM
jgi:hypothetical protein